MKLKKIIYKLMLVVISFNCQSQSKSLELGEGFAAFIVKDIQVSMDWYSTYLGFEIVNQVYLEERGIKQANLSHGDSKIELIESMFSIDPVINQNKKVLVQGIFKVGFTVSNFNEWKEHLILHKLITERDVVTNPIDKKLMLIIKDPDGNRIQLFENK